MQKKLYLEIFILQKRLRRIIISLRNSPNINIVPKHTQKEAELNKFENNKRDCIRAKNIIEKVINEDNKTNKIYIGVHPSFSKKSVKFLISNQRKKKNALILL